MKKGAIGIVVALLLAVLVIAGGAYYVGTHEEVDPATSQQEATTTAQTPPSLPKTQVVVENTKPKLQTYRNDKYGFTVDYPSNFTFHDSQSTPDSWTIIKLREGRVLKPIDCGGIFKQPDEVSVTWYITDRQNPTYAGVNLVTSADKAYNNPKYIPVVIGDKILKVQRSIPGMCENADSFIWMEPSGRYIVHFTVNPSETNLIEEYKAIIASFAFHITASPKLQTYRTPTERAKAGQIEFVFDYPVGYRVLERGYVTPGGFLYPLAQVVRDTEEKDNNFVTVSSKTTMSTGKDISCADGFTKCKEFGNYLVYTASKDAYVLSLYDIVASSLHVNPVK